MQTKQRVSKVILRKKNILTVPREIADQMQLAEGDEFIVTEEQGRIVLTPALSIPADQAWFWTPQWQARIAEAEADRLAGNSTTYRLGGRVPRSNGRRVAADADFMRPWRRSNVSTASSTRRRRLRSGARWRFSSRT
ncbi:MAG TPA: AbrB/MazE/SpoVT family DNA-binding domain-containing protein [Actinocrinis sp.]|uniref:AbrB/MazE/SpoVT family DNA-binding domain-containing protein n=1 Tax=Actinocrinis sp. TaxID=1920516 RepID=UPI002DDCC15B|nr:AbrB/MazE/SpoVT family DNA-binding domain-containing protein [Actinocrinis sp.]HEV2345871.1 AbrB/MazE/SpoVT family DNA-binding domain-containing protein [Actinocrinis sp.]